MKDVTRTFDAIRRVLEGGSGTRPERVRRAAEMIRQVRDYRWVGIYDVEGDEIVVVAWSGPGEPAHTRFSATAGLSGDAVRRGSALVVGDVTQDLRYLTTLGTTRSEIVVPILDPRGGPPIGVIDVESDRTNAFTDDDRLFLERCAAVLAASS